MRYYKIELSDASSGEVKSSYTSFDGSNTNPNALDIELDLSVVPFATPTADSYARVWGIPLQTIAQASDFNNMGIAIYGGMQRGLPLAKPQQSGLLVKGYVLQAFGNWIGVDQTLDLRIAAGTGPKGTGSPGKPQNLVLNWKKGTQLSAAIQQTLNASFPEFTINININQKLVLGNDEVGYFQDLVQFAQYVKATSLNIIGGNYQGVDILITQSSISVYDGTSQTSPKQIAFTDLIGQPTWIDSPSIQIKCVMRADLTVQDFIKLPPGQVTTTPQSLSQFRNNSVFQGVFQISEIRHVGHFRQSDAASWVSIITAFPTSMAA